MKRLRLSVLFALIVGVASGVIAAESDSTWTAIVGGRFETLVSVEADSPGFRWNHVSRSPADHTRFMLDLRGGHSRFGKYYAKAAARWDDLERTEGSVDFRFEQGNYTWANAGSDGELMVSLYANERRYFTNSLGVRLLDDDAAAQFDDHYGLRVDYTSTTASIRGAMIGAVIDDGKNRRGLGLADASWGGNVPALGDMSGGVGLRYVSGDGTVDHTIFELTGAWLDRDGGGLFASFQQAAFGEGLSYPSGAFSFDELDLFRPGDWLPENSVVLVEAHTGGTKTRLGKFDAVHRYRATGQEYTDPISAVAPGEVRTQTGIYWNHDRYAVDGFVVFDEWRRKTAQLQTSQRLIVHGRASLRDGSEGVLRAVFEDNSDSGGDFGDESFLHASWGRHLRKLSTSVHVLAGRIDRGEFGSRFAAETRFNATASTSFYGRLVTDESKGSNDAVYIRIEFRPLDHVFASFGFGRSFIGDDPYVVEDPDIGMTGEADRVYTMTVRGDF